MLVNRANPNGIEVPFTAAEEAQADKDDAAQVIRLQAKADAETAAEAKAASGKQKLKDLGLDDEEIKALTGI
jgi:hypothetical protein